MDLTTEAAAGGSEQAPMTIITADGEGKLRIRNDKRPWFRRYTLPTRFLAITALPTSDAIRAQAHASRHPLGGNPTESVLVNPTMCFRPIVPG